MRRIVEKAIESVVFVSLGLLMIAFLNQIWLGFFMALGIVFMITGAAVLLYKNPNDYENDRRHSPLEDDLQVDDRSDAKGDGSIEMTVAGYPSRRLELPLETKEEPESRRDRY